LNYDIGSGHWLLWVFGPDILGANLSF
jgi:hypothetical protein